MNCELCRGELSNKLITYTEWNDTSPVIVKNVPAKVCVECNGEVLTPPVLNAIKKVIENNKNGSYVKVPVFELSDDDVGDPRLNNPDYHSPTQCLFRCTTDLRTLKHLKEGKAEVEIWVDEGDVKSHPHEKILAQLSKAFEPTSDSSVKNVVKTTENGYIVYEVKVNEEDKKEELRPVAKMTYKDEIWSLFWIWRSGIWQEYGTYSTLSQVVEQIKEDKLRFCA